ncbi:MAG: MFS transporter [Candidatus Pacebacteria bacterium]|nr:MFS transporter [Candidatus Paceibacterota bacterium]
MQTNKAKKNVILQLNIIVKRFIIADLILFSGWGLISPLMSIFIVQKINGDLINVGVTVAIYWFIRSIIELPLSNKLDEIRGEKDDFYALIVGLFIVAISAFTLATVKTINQLYLVQALQGFGFAMYYSSWSGIFSRYLDKNRIAFSWSADHIAVGIASAFGGIFGGLIATIFGFEYIFIMGGILSLVAAFVLISVPKIIFPKSTVNKGNPILDHSAKSIT